MSGCIRRNVIMYQVDVDRLEEMKSKHGIPFSVFVRMAIEEKYMKMKAKEKR